MSERREIDCKDTVIARTQADGQIKRPIGLSSGNANSQCRMHHDEVVRVDAARPVRARNDHGRVFARRYIYGSDPRGLSGNVPRSAEQCCGLGVRVLLCSWGARRSNPSRSLLV